TIPRSHRADQTLVLKGLSGTEPSYVPSLRHPRNLSCSCFVPYTERLNNMGKQEDHCKRGSRHRQRNNRRLPYGLGRQRIGKARKAVQTRCGIKHAVAHFFTTNDLQVDVVRAVPLQLSEPPRQRLDIHPTPPALVESNCDGVDDRGV